MFEPDTTAYYLLLFGGVILGPLFLVGSVFVMVAAFTKRSGVFAWLGLASLLIFAIIVIAHPISSMLLWNHGAEARMSEMKEEAHEEGFIGKSVTDFTDRFGRPDENRLLQRRDGEILIYRCRPGFAYAWSDLVVYTDRENVTAIRIDD